MSRYLMVFIRMMKINNLAGDITYEVNMFGRLRDILHELGDKTLADLDFSDYNHTWFRTKRILKIHGLELNG
jgi:hypothetical protein